MLRGGGHSTIDSSLKSNESSLKVWLENNHLKIDKKLKDIKQNRWMKESYNIEKMGIKKSME